MFQNCTFSSVDLNSTNFYNCEFLKLNLTKIKFLGTYFLNPKIDNIISSNNLEFDENDSVRIRITNLFWKRKPELSRVVMIIAYFAFFAALPAAVY